MKSDTSVKPTRNSTPWSLEEIVTMACTLNFRIDSIRENLLSDQKEGIRFANNLLSESIGSGCSPRRVERKMKQLWLAHRSDTQTESSPVILYLYGIYSKTLPAIDIRYPGVLSRIAAEVKKMQQETDASDRTPGFPKESLRRSKRTVVGNDYYDETKCFCSFTHDIKWVHCDRCPSWQHAYCYYDTEESDKLPDAHVCRECREDNEHGFVESLSRLSVIDEEHVEYSRLKQRARQARLEPFEAPHYDEIKWGPEDEEIQDFMGKIAHNIRLFTYMVTADLDLRDARITEDRDLMELITGSFGSARNGEMLLCKDRAEEIIHSHALSSIVAKAMRDWVFYPPTEIDSWEAILLNQYHRQIAATHSLQVLQSLHRSAWVELLEDNPQRFRSFVEQKAQFLGRRLLKTILPLITRPLDVDSTFEQWLKTSAHGLQIHQIFTRIFTTAIQLKLYLPLSKMSFELYSPAPATPTDPLYMVTENEEALPRSKEVRTCMLPGVIEVLPEPNSVEKDKLGHVMIDAETFVVLSNETRAKGRVISLALISIA